MSRSLPLLLLGAWLGLLVSSWVMASVNFRTAERVAGPASAPELHARLDLLPQADRRLALRYLASEINRWMFRWVAVAQAALGTVLVALLWRAGGAPRVLALCALAVVAVQLGVLAPMIATIGRTIDFMARPLPPAIGRRFGLLHGAYVLLDFAKAIVLCAAAFVLARR